MPRRALGAQRHWAEPSGRVLSWAEDLTGNAVATEASADSVGDLELGWPFRLVLTEAGGRAVPHGCRPGEQVPLLPEGRGGRSVWIMSNKAVGLTGNLGFHKSMQVMSESSSRRSHGHGPASHDNPQLQKSHRDGVRHDSMKGPAFTHPAMKETSGENGAALESLCENAFL